ncbi:type I phosphomannose isomerase catalytic subunit [Psychroserpens sp. XS_ASV72]|uniref:type I phosphomannose isomerase catalytic subunit n=1 Tax=Psychroserpens sp. XS_ASV72 TaxID=3241293 RepID=UPI003512CCB4
MNVYPIKFDPILKEKIWGGHKLKSQLNKPVTSKTTGESWEISGVEGNVSIVSNGIYKGKTLTELLQCYKSNLLGFHNYETFGDEFPLLIKYLDAKTNLSVQVHPDDKMARQYHNSFGKTEMWYIMDSDPDAEIVLGLKNETINPSVLKSLHKDNVNQYFNRNQVKKGDSYFVPAGKIHAIGAGVLAAEIQQTSDITYRVYDWDRLDANGNARELHTDLAVQATKVTPNHCITDYSLQSNTSTNLVETPFFTTNIIEVKNKLTKTYESLDSFMIYMCVEGALEMCIDGYSECVKMGETVLVPATVETISFKGNQARLLEVYIDAQSSQSLKKVS